MNTRIISKVLRQGLDTYQLAQMVNTKHSDVLTAVGVHGMCYKNLESSPVTMGSRRPGTTYHLPKRGAIKLLLKYGITREATLDLVTAEL